MTEARNSRRSIRILIAKVGLDGHDRGAKVLATLLKKHGFEVIYLGLFNTPEMVVQAAIQEDADVIGISFLSGGHLILAPKIVEQLRENNLGNVHLIVGGVIPGQDESELLAMGVERVFRGSLVGEVVDYLDEQFGLKGPDLAAAVSSNP